jgi:hypothetical protein
MQNPLLLERLSGHLRMSCIITFEDMSFKLIMAIANGSRLVAELNEITRSLSYVFDTLPLIIKSAVVDAFPPKLSAPPRKLLSLLEEECTSSEFESQEKEKE